MKRAVVFLFVSVFVRDLHAQLDLGISGGFRTGFVTSKTFAQFAESYNSIYSSAMKKDLGQFGMSHGWGLNLDFEVSGFYGSLRFSQVNAAEKLEYNSGGKRHFDFSQFLTAVGCGFGVHEEEFAFHMGIGLSGGTDRIKTYYEYADGTKSYGQEKLLNGVYDGLHFCYAADLGLSVGLGGGAMIYCQLEYLFGDVATSFQLNEWHHDKSLDSYNVYPIGLPLDYDEWLISAPNFEYPVDKYVRADFNGLRFEVGMRFQFGAL